MLWASRWINFIDLGVEVSFLNINTMEELREKEQYKTRFQRRSGIEAASTRRVWGKWETAQWHRAGEMGDTTPSVLQHQRRGMLEIKYFKRGFVSEWFQHKEMKSPRRHIARYTHTIITHCAHLLNLRLCLMDTLLCNKCKYYIFYKFLKEKE